MNYWRTAMAGAIVGLGSLCGCEDPPNLVPVSPPGAIIPRVSPDAEPAQAQGESAPSKSTSTAAEPAKKTEAAAKLANPKSAPPTTGVMRKTAGGVIYETIKEGTGPEYRAGDRAKIHYTGKLESGTIFDSSHRRERPLDVTIGVTPLIKGWDEGIPGMKTGELRRLTIPPELGYGAAGKPPNIGPNATLIFDVEMVEFTPSRER